MEIAMLVIGIILLVFAVFLIVAVLMQQGKAHNLSGTIAGGAETFFGKSKAQTINKKLSILTTVVAIVFVLLVCTVYIMQPSATTAGDIDSFPELVEFLFGGGEEEEMGKEVEHDHDGDGVADHDADEHDHAAEDEKSEETTTADTTTADTTTADTTAADPEDSAAE